MVSVGEYIYISDNTSKHIGGGRFNWIILLSMCICRSRCWMFRPVCAIAKHHSFTGAKKVRIYTCTLSLEYSVTIHCNYRDMSLLLGLRVKVYGIYHNYASINLTFMLLTEQFQLMPSTWWFLWMHWHRWWTTSCCIFSCHWLHSVESLTGHGISQQSQWKKCHVLPEHQLWLKNLQWCHQEFARHWLWWHFSPKRWGFLGTLQLYCYSDLWVQSLRFPLGKCQCPGYFQSLVTWHWSTSGVWCF